MPIAERAGYVTEVCADDGVLREQLLAMLLEVDEAGAVLEPPPLDHDDRVIESLQEIEGYHIVGVIGRGAMSTIFEAEQDYPRRSVALKILRPGCASTDVVRRFRHEAEILAQLRHPGIAQVYDAGTQLVDRHRVVYLALELIHGGRPITEVVTEEQMDLRVVLELMVQVCDAVQDAHLNGVIHRDLKPSNILVDENAQIKVIDFGIARVSAPGASLTTMHTLPGTLIGTLAYMSPEQCDGHLAADVRSDVYAIGVVLFELLCGTLPHTVEGRTISQVIRAKCTTDPPSPASKDARLKGNVDAIILTALQRLPDCRYQSVAEIGRDIRRHLAGEPISARAPGAWTRAATWIARHPVLTSAAMSAIIAVTSLTLTFIVVVAIAIQPYRVSVNAEGRSASLLSRGGIELHTWPSGSEEGIRSAQLVGRPVARGGGRLALVAYSRHHPDDSESGRLVAYDITAPKRVLWTSADTPYAIPPLHPERATDLDAGQVLIADIFDDVPGDEIVFQQGLSPYSQMSLRIFDCAGALHFEVWHDGGFGDMVWLSEARRLVVVGETCQYRWDERGVPMTDRTYPSVVLALEPERGYVSSGWLVLDDEVLDPHVAWYKWIGPADALNALNYFKVTLEHPFGDWSRDSHVDVAVGMDLGHGNTQPTRAGLTFTIDAAGNEVNRAVSDGYHRNREVGLLPPMDTFDLMDLDALPCPAPGAGSGIESARSRPRD